MILLLPPADQLTKPVALAFNPTTPVHDHGEGIVSASCAIIPIDIKRADNKSSLNSLKSDLQRVNSAIANIVSAIEKGVFTHTTKNRLEELEKQQKIIKKINEL